MRKIDKRLADLKAAQESGRYTLCPRCGQDTMNPNLYHNALSRITDIMVCDTCYPRKTVIRENMTKLP